MTACDWCHQAIPADAHDVWHVGNSYILSSEHRFCTSLCLALWATWNVSSANRGDDPRLPQDRTLPAAVSTWMRQQLER